MTMSSCTTANPNACHSHWIVVGRAPTRAGLVPQLRKHISKDFSLSDFTTRPGHTGWAVDVLDRRHRVMGTFEVFRQHGGAWAAREWGRCTD